MLTEILQLLRCIIVAALVMLAVAMICFFSGGIVFDWLIASG